MNETDWRYMSFTELEHHWYGYVRDSDRSKEILSTLEFLTEHPYEPKPSKNIRAEKTRDYRRRRPQSRPYQPECALAAGILFILIGGRP